MKLRDVNFRVFPKRAVIRNGELVESPLSQLENHYKLVTSSHARSFSMPRAENNSRESEIDSKLAIK